MKSINRYASSTQGAKLGSSDPIAAAIGLLRPLTVSESSLHAAGPWAVGFDPFPHVELGVVARGECWLTMEGHEPVLLREGDFYLLGNPPPYVLASAPTEQPLDARSLWGGSPRGAVRIGSEAQEDTYLCGGHFSFDDTNAPVLLDVLPPLVHVRAADPRGKLLAHLSALLVTEVETTAVGGSLVLDHLAQILFIHMLRAHAAHADRPAGWEHSATTASEPHSAPCTQTWHTDGHSTNSRESATCHARRLPQLSRPRSELHHWST